MDIYPRTKTPFLGSQKLGCCICFHPWYKGLEKLDFIQILRHIRPLLCHWSYIYLKTPYLVHGYSLFSPEPNTKSYQIWFFRVTLGTGTRTFSTSTYIHNSPPGIGSKFQVKNIFWIFILGQKRPFLKAQTNLITAFVICDTKLVPIAIYGSKNPFIYSPFIFILYHGMIDRFYRK